MILPNIDDFLSGYKTEKLRKEYARQLSIFRSYLEKIENLKSFNEVKRIHVLRYCNNYINKKKWRKSYKSKRYQTIQQYLKFLFEYETIPERLHLTKKPNFNDYVSDMVLNRMTLPLPTNEDIKQLLSHAKKHNFKSYIAMALLAHNGMRISELISIKLSHINLQERTITSGLEEIDSKESVCFYFIPEKLIPDLEEYIDDLTSQYRDPIYLFPGNTQTGYCTKHNINRNFKKYRDILVKNKKINDCKVNPHCFRKKINHDRLAMNCPYPLMAILLNQEPEGVNAQNYLDEVRHNIKVRYTYWKKYTPIYF